MIDARRRFYLKSIRIVHILAIYLAFILAAMKTGLFDILAARVPEVFPYTLVILSLFLFLHITLSLLFFYFRHEDSIIMPSFRYEASTLVFFVSMVSILIMPLLFLIIFSSPFTLNFFQYFISFSIITGVFLLSANRTIMNWYNNRSHMVRNIVIIGSNQRAINFNEHIAGIKILGIRVFGFIDDKDYSFSGVKLIGKIDDYSEIIRTNVIHSTVIHLPIRSFYDQIQKVIDASKEQGVQVYYLSNLFEYGRCTINVSDFWGIPSILLSNTPREDWRFFVKGSIDLFIAGILLILALPVILVAIILMKISSPGPAFFIQKRVGYYKKTFNLIKLRTMVPNAEKLHNTLEKVNEMDGPVFKIVNDPRVTKVGRWLRRYGIDELPQLLNILKGDMSLVGPRPLALRDYNGFSEDWLRRRFSVKPGLICYWQCKDDRHKCSFTEWMQLDMQYIDDWNLWVDCKIILQTIPAILKGTGV